MILADKIIRLRKKNGWSQEELAEKMNVSRQAVSKWEAAQTTPDLEKILQLGNLFGVTTDYLLKDEIEDEEFTDGIDETPIRKITLAEANDYMKQRKDASVKIAIATFLCILSVIPLLLLGAISELTSLPIGLNQWIVSKRKPRGFHQWSLRRMCACSWATTCSRSCSFMLNGR